LRARAAPAATTSPVHTVLHAAPIHPPPEHTHTHTDTTTTTTMHTGVA
jgi:hypothetical protein